MNAQNRDLEYENEELLEQVKELDKQARNTKQLFSQVAQQHTQTGQSIAELSACMEDDEVQRKSNLEGFRELREEVSWDIYRIPSAAVSEATIEGPSTGGEESVQESYASSEVIDVPPSNKPQKKARPEAVPLWVAAIKGSLMRQTANKLPDGLNAITCNPQQSEVSNQEFSNDSAVGSESEEHEPLSKKEQRALRKRERKRKGRGGNEQR